jgi:hypothetical protein
VENYVHPYVNQTLKYEYINVAENLFFSDKPSIHEFNKIYEARYGRNPFMALRKLSIVKGLWEQRPELSIKSRKHIWEVVHGTYRTVHLCCCIYQALLWRNMAEKSVSLNT